MYAYVEIMCFEYLRLTKNFQFVDFKPVHYNLQYNIVLQRCRVVINLQLIKLYRPKYYELTLGLWGALGIYPHHLVGNAALV